MEMGEIIYKIAKECNIPEESLPREYKDAKELYVKHNQTIELTNVVLRYWQESLPNHIKPSEREIIWSIGRRGNERKSWFQKSKF